MDVERRASRPSRRAGDARRSTSHRGIVCQLLVCRLESGAAPIALLLRIGAIRNLISRRQQFVVPAIACQRWIVQSCGGAHTVAVARFRERVFSAAGMPIGIRSHHHYLSPLKNLRTEFVSRYSRPRIALLRQTPLSVWDYWVKMT